MSSCMFEVSQLYNTCPNHFHIRAFCTFLFQPFFILIKQMTLSKYALSESTCRSILKPGPAIAIGELGG